MDKLSIVIPAYNEEKRIGNTLKEYSRFFDYLVKQKQIDYELLIVINNTKDRTEEIVKDYQKKNRKLRYLNFKQGGKGFAIIEGFKDCLTRDSSLIGFVDADMATGPEEYWKLVQSIGSRDGAIADRYLKESKVNPPPTTSRLFARKLFNFFIRSLLFLSYGDTQCGAKIFRRNAVKSIILHLTMSQWAFDVDLLYSLKKNGFKIKSVPTVWTDKEYSKINFWQAGPRMALGVARLRILNSPFKRFIRIYDKLLGFVPK